MSASYALLQGCAPDRHEAPRRGHGRRHWANRRRRGARNGSLPRFRCASDEWKSALRRPRLAQPQVLRYADLEVNLETRAVTRAGKDISLSARDYDRLVALLDELIDEVGDDEKHPLASLMEVLGTLIEKYEDEHVPELTDF